MPNTEIRCHIVQLFAKQTNWLPTRKIICQTKVLFVKQNDCLEDQKVSVKQIDYLPNKVIVWRIRKCLPNRLIICQSPNKLKCLRCQKVFAKRKALLAIEKNTEGCAVKQFSGSPNNCIVWHTNILLAGYLPTNAANCIKLFGKLFARVRRTCTFRSEWFALPLLMPPSPDSSPR